MKISPTVRRCILFCLLVVVLAPMGRGQVGPADEPFLVIRDEVELSCFANTLSDLDLRGEAEGLLAAGPIHSLSWASFFIGNTKDRLFMGSLAIGDPRTLTQYLRFVYYHDSDHGSQPQVPPDVLAYGTANSRLMLNVGRDTKALLHDSDSLSFLSHVLSTAPTGFDLIGNPISSFRVNRRTNSGTQEFDLVVDFDSVVEGDVIRGILVTGIQNGDGSFTVVRVATQ